MLAENKQEYIECIYDLTREGFAAKTSDIAEKMGVKPASVTEMVKKLTGEGFLIHERYRGVFLTKEGLREAKALKRKHRLLESFLSRVLGLKTNIHEQACEMEHALSEEAADALEKMMDYPKLCPDKKPIPSKDEIKKPTESLLALPENVKAKVIGITPGEKLMERLRSMGIGDGVNIHVIAKEPFGGPIVVKVGNTKISIGRGMAKKIIVQR